MGIETSIGTVSIRVRGLTGIPLIKPGDALVPFLSEAVRRADLKLTEQDIVVVTQKIVSKAEGRTVCLADVTPSPRARELATRLGKDPRKIEVILRETRRIVRAGPGVLICENHRGQICANAGVDESNLSESDTMLLQPLDSDASADRLRRDFLNELGVSPGVLITDSYGRPWRLGLVNVAIGAAGLPVIEDLRGKRDFAGKPLVATELAVADELASMAGLVMRKLEMIPAAVIQGFRSEFQQARAVNLLRPSAQDLFR